MSKDAIGGGDSPLILLLGGTSEGREIAQLLEREGCPFIISVADKYGKKLLPLKFKCQEGRLNQQELANFLKEEKIKLVIDATHPFAVEISKNAINACRDSGVAYLRFERASVDLPDAPLIHRVNDFDEAASLAIELGKRIFLTTGSKNLAVFVEKADQVDALVFARVLPSPSIISNCSRLIPPAQIVALQGPYSKEFNQALFQEYRADVVVTKESGSQGGTLTKIDAALSLGIPVVIVKRPAVAYPCQVGTYQELLTTIAQM